MAFFEKLKEKINFGTLDRRRAKQLTYVKYGVDPREEWQEVKEIGDGSFGKVYLTKNKRTGSEAALKQMGTQDESDMESFAVEISILNEHRHPNIVSLFESYFFEDKLWLYMEYCEAGAIDTVMLDLDKPLTEAQITCLCAQTCAALDFLHSPKVMVIHRDLKAGNLLLDSGGNIKLADFGISAQMEVSRPHRDSSVGTPYWMAPEVIKCETSKEEPYNFKADIWSLGITLIECAQIHPPHSDLQPMRVLFRIIKSPPPTLSKPSDWTPDFKEFLAKCLVKDPMHRSSSSQLLKHRFVTKIEDNRRALKQLYLEFTAEITDEIKEEIDEDWTNSEQISSTSSSLIDLSSNCSTPSTPQNTLSKPPTFQKVPSPTLNRPSSANIPPSPLQKPPASINSSPPLTHKPPSSTNKSPPPRKTKKPAPLPPNPRNPSKPASKPSPITFNLSTNLKNDTIKLETPSDTSTNRYSILPYLQQPSIHQEIVDNIVDEVICSNHHKPSIPSIVLDVIINTIDTNVDGDVGEEDEFDVAIKISNEDQIDFTRMSDSSLLEACLPVCHLLIEEVLCSTHRQPSISGVVLDMMTELIEGVEEEGGGERDRGFVNNGVGTAKYNTGNNIVVISKSGDDGRSSEDTNDNDSHYTSNVRRGAVKNHKAVSNDGPGKGYTGKNDRIRSATPLANGKVTEKHDTYQKTAGKQGGYGVVGMSSGEEERKNGYIGKNGGDGSGSGDGGENGGMEKAMPRRNAFKKTLTRTRKFSTVDGQTTTTTTNITNHNKLLLQHQLMKRNLREIKRQKNMEKRQLLNLDLQIKYKLCDLANKVEKQKMTTKKLSDLETEQNMKSARQEVERLEESLNVELKVQEKRLKMEQDKSLKLFLEQQKKDLKTLKSDLKGGTLSKKDATLSKNSVRSEQVEKERNFLREQTEGMEMMKKRLLQSQKKMRGNTEMKLMQNRHQAIKSREDELWKIELEGKRVQRDLTQKHLRNMFVLKRQHMITRHNVEMQTLYKANEELVEDLRRKHNIEKKQMPKTEKQKFKASYVAFKKAFKDTGEAARKKLAEFEQQERKRMERVVGQMRATQEKEEQALNNENQLKVQELEHIQQDKLEMLKKQEADMLAALKQKGVEEEIKFEKHKMKSQEKLQQVFSDEIKAHNSFFYDVIEQQQTDF